MANNYPSTSIIPPGRRRMNQAIPTTDIVPDTAGRRQTLGGFASTSITPLEDTRTSIEADYKVVLSDHNGFEEVILEHADTRNEAYAAYKAWLVEFKADPLVSERTYPPDTWAICTRNGELSWKTNPFIG
jgi:hypothetical protein